MCNSGDIDRTDVSVAPIEEATRLWTWISQGSIFFRTSINPTKSSREQYVSSAEIKGRPSQINKSTFSHGSPSKYRPLRRNSPFTSPLFFSRPRRGGAGKSYFLLRNRRRRRERNGQRDRQRRAPEIYAHKCACPLSRVLTSKRREN